MAKGTTVGFLNFGIDGDNKELMKKLEQVKKEALTVEQLLQNINKTQGKTGSNRRPTLLQETRAQELVNQSIEKQRLTQIRANEVMQRTSNAQRLNYQRLQTEIARTNSLTQNLGDSTNHLQSLFLKVGGAAAFIQLAREIVNVRGEMQQLEIAFTTMLKSPEKAVKLMSELKDFAANTPFGLMDSAKGAKQLIAYGSQAESVVDELKMLGDVASGISAPLGDIVYLYGTLRTQGRAYAVDMRQFANRGIPIYEEVAKVMKISTDQVQEFVSAGKVGFKEVEQAFRNMTSDSGMYGGLMEKQTESVTGQIEKLKDNIQFMFNDIGKSSQGAIYTAIDGAATLVDNYEAVGKTLLGLMATYGAYKTAVYLLAVAENARYQAALAQMAGYSRMTVLTDLLRMKTEALNKVLNRNAYAILAAAAVALAYGVYQAVTATSQLEESQKRVQDSTDKFNSSVENEKLKLDILFESFQNAKKGTEEYQKAKEDILKQAESYKTGLSKEIDLLNDVAGAYKAISAAAIQSSKDKAIASGTQSAIDAYSHEWGKNIKNIQKNFVSKFGKEQGTILLNSLKDSLSNDKGFSKEVEDAIKSFDKIMYSAQGAAGSVQSYQYNAINLSIGNIRKSKDILDKERQDLIDMFGKGKTDSGNGSTPLKTLSQQADEARGNISKLKSELKDLRSGKTESANYAKDIEDKAKELKEAQDKLSYILSGKSYSGNQKDINKNDKELDSAQKLAEKLTQLQLDTEAARISAMQDGKEKRLKEIDSEYNETLARIAKNRQDLIDAYNDSKGLKGKSKVTVGNYQTVTPDIYSTVIDAQLQAEKTKNAKTIELNRETNKELDALRNDVASKFKTDLDNKLHEIELYYKEQVRLQKLSQDEANLLADKESLLAKKDNDLKYNDVNSSLAISGFENNYSDLGMVEYTERRKNEITRRYAQERLEILQSMGTEQNQIEADQLQNTIDSYDKKQSKPKSIKGLIDEKAFNQVKKHFLSLGKSEEEAEKKTTDFFSGFTEGGEVAVDVIGTMQNVFGGMNEDLDRALQAAMSIAKGFAEGGLIGGIKAAAEQVISVTISLLSAKKEVDQSMIDGYNAYVEAIDRLIDKQVESLESLGATDFSKTALKTYNDLVDRIIASRNLFNETMKSGSSMWSHSLGNKANKMLRGYSDELKRAGIYTTDLNNMTNDQLVTLMSIPEVWGKLHGDLRQYIEDMAEAKDQAADLQQEIQTMMLGFDFSDITDAFVDAFTDNSITDALTVVSDKIDDWIGQVVGNIIKQVALIEPVTAAVNQLMKGVGKFDEQGNLIGFKGKDEIDSNVFGQFKDTLMNVASGFGQTWADMLDMLKKEGINIGQTSAKGDTLSKGIQGLTEDTGNIVAAYTNAIRSDVSATRTAVAQLLQLSQTNSNTFALQLAELVKIQVNTFNTANNTAQIASTAQATYDLLKSATIKNGVTGWNLL